MWRLADTKAGNSIVDHHCSGVDLASKDFTTRAVCRPDAGGKPVGGVVR